MVPLSTGAELDDIFRRKKVQSLVSQAPPVPENLNINQFPGNANVTQHAQEKQQRGLEVLKNIGKQLSGGPELAQNLQQTLAPPIGQAPWNQPQGQVQPPGGIQPELPLQKHADPGQFLKDPYNIPPTQITEAPPAIPATAPEIPEATPTVSKILEANVAPIRPYEPTPETQALIKKELQGPGAQSEWEKAHQTSKKRHLGALLAGIGTGILYRRPDKGMQMYSEIQHAPYLREVQKFEQERAPLERVVGEIQKDIGSQVGAFSKRATGEAALERAATGATKAPSQIFATTERGKEAGAKALDITTKTVGTPEHEAAFPQTVKEAGAIEGAKSEAKAAAKPPKPITIMTRKGGRLEGVWFAKDPSDPKGKTYRYFHAADDPSKPPVPIDEGSIRSVMESGKRPMSAEDYAVQSAIESGEYNVDTLASLHQKFRPPVDALGRTLRHEEQQLKVEEGREKRSEKVANVKAAVESGILNPETISEVDPKIRENVKTQFHTAVPELPFPKKLSTNANNRKIAAGVSKKHVSELRAIINSGPDLGNLWTPVIGNFLASGGKSIGTIPGMSPDQEKLAFEVMTRFASLVIQETTAASGSRTGKYLVDLIGKNSPKAGDNLNALMGKLNAIDGVADVVRDEAMEEMFGEAGTHIDPETGREASSYQVVNGKAYVWNPEKKKMRRVHFPGE